MFRTFSGTADPIEHLDEAEKEIEQGIDSGKSNASTKSDPDAIERVSSRDGVEEAEPDDGKRSPRPTSELKRTASRGSNASKALSKIGSRFTTHSIRDPGPAPDGGFKAWLQVALGWLAIATTWGWVNCYGVFQTYYTGTLDASPSTISWIGTVQSFMTFFIGAFSGRLLDAGYFLPTVIVGATLQVLGIFLMSICTEYWQLLLTQGFLNGIGGGIFFTPCMGLVATYFSKKRSFALGVASTGNSAGGLIYPVIVRELLPKIGFPWTVRVLGFVNLGFLALVIALMKPRLPPCRSGAIIDWSAFKELPYTLFVISIFFQVWTIYYTLYYITSFGVEAVGLPFADATSLLILVNGIGIPARLIPGIIADRFGQLNTIVPISWCLVIVTWNWISVKSVVGLYVWTSFYGFNVAGLQCLIPPVTASLTADMRVIGTRLGMVFSCMGLASLTGPPIGGALQSLMHGNYLGAQIWSAASCMLCAIVLTLTRMSRAGRKLKVKV